ncbi:MAG: aconitate hydratase [Polyangiales bacterium]
MGQSLTHKILQAHLVTGELVPGTEISIRVDQTLTQDATGTMAYLQFEAMSVPRVKTKCSVSYVDHNMLQDGFENADDHRYLQSVAAKIGAWFSRPGNGICHQVHRERFSVPGETLLGSDSHTPTCGAVGMIAIGVGGLDVAMGMAGQPFTLPCPKVVGVKLTGKLQPWVSGKDVILEMLRRLTVKGGVGRIFEYYGPGLDSLPMTHRFTITNMGAELGATTSIFPADVHTKAYLEGQGRGAAFKEMGPDADAKYDEHVEIDLDKLEPLVAAPHSPDNVKTVREVAGQKAAQSSIGSCTNSSYEDLTGAAHMLKGRQVAAGTSFTVTPGSKQVFEMIAREETLYDLIAAGARILEASCGPCIGNGQSPPSGSVSVRSFNRNFEGRSGTKDAQVYLASVETCVATAIKGEITDPRDLGISHERIDAPAKFLVNDTLLIPPPAETESKSLSVTRGPNIAPLPEFTPMPDTLDKRVLIKVGDNISTDHIMPAGASILRYRSNIPKISEFVFSRVDPEFHKRAKEWGGGVIIGGDNYGQGSSREHAALAPLYLGIRLVAVRSFARIHLANLINFGILPTVFANPADYDKVAMGDELHIEGIRGAIEGGKNVTITNKTRNVSFEVVPQISTRAGKIILAGGLLKYRAS